MCSIIIAADEEFALKQIEANAYRGTLNSSISIVDDEDRLFSVTRRVGPPDVSYLEELFDDINYVIIHQQAPTDAMTDESCIHPSEFDDSYLWHNGIIKADQVKKWQHAYGDYTWDTHLLHKHFNITDDLNNIDGSFACVWASGSDVFVFRNAIAPLFYSARGFSSTRFSESTPVPKDKVFKIIFDGLFSLEEVNGFKSYNVPYIL